VSGRSSSSDIDNDGKWARGSDERPARQVPFQFYVWPGRKGKSPKGKAGDLSFTRGTPTHGRWGPEGRPPRVSLDIQPGINS
jgi:hypothetical protein